MDVNKAFKQYAFRQWQMNQMTYRAFIQVWRNGGYVDPIKGKRSQADADRVWIRFEQLLKKARALRA